MLTEKHVQLALWHYLDAGRYKVIYPNAQLWNDECDLLAVTKADILYEYEIKLTPSDLKADVKKATKNIHSRYKSKHERLQKCNDPRSPQKFVFVTTFPTKNIPDWAGHILLVSDQQLIELDLKSTGSRIRLMCGGHYEYYNMVLVKQPMALHKHKVDSSVLSTLQRNIMYKYWRLHYREIQSQNNKTRGKRK